MVARYEGYNGVVTIEGPSLTLSRSGMTAKLAGHLSGDRVLPLAAVTGLVFQEATITTNGHLQIAFGGQALIDPRHSPAPRNPNTVVFTRRQRDSFAALAGFLSHVVEVNRTTGVDSAGAYAAAADPLLLAQAQAQEAAAAQNGRREEHETNLQDAREQMRAAGHEFTASFQGFGQDLSRIGDEVRTMSQEQAAARAEASQQRAEQRAADAAEKAERARRAEAEKAERAREAEAQRQQAADERAARRASQQEDRTAQRAAREEARTAKLASKIGTAAERPDIMSAAARMSRTFGGKREIKNLPRYLQADEQVLMLGQGTYDNHQGVIALTDQRVIFLFQGLLNTEMHDYPHRTISSVRTVGRIGLGHLVIQAGGGNVVITGVSKTDLEPLAAAIRGAVAQCANTPIAAQSPTSVPKAEPDTFEQIRKLSELHAAGILTSDEFAAKKQQLLDRL